MGTAFWSAGSQLVEGCENGIRMYAGQEALRELTETVNGRISDDMDLSKFKLLAVDGAGSITLISQSFLLDSTELPFGPSYQLVLILEGQPRRVAVNMHPSCSTVLAVAAPFLFVFHVMGVCT